MNKFSAKNKIIVLLIAWLAVIFVMVSYVFKILDNANNTALDNMSQDRQNLAVVQAEDQSFKQAQSDLKKLAEQPLQPADFFSRDITLVKELEILENLQQKYGVQMDLSGVSGTVNNLTPAPTKSQIVVAPYGISLTGSLVQVTNFIEALENVSFVTDINGLTISLSQNTVAANLSANFYLLNQ